MRLAAAGRMARLVTVADHARAVLYNGLGRRDAARDAALSAFERDDFGYKPFVVVELAEASSRIRDEATVGRLLRDVSERSLRLRRTGRWEPKRACVLWPATATPPRRATRESIDRLSRTRMRAYLARVHLLYGEWLRREKRRTEARQQLREAYEMLAAMGVGGFAERARRELRATGEAIRKRSMTKAIELTAQEAQIARLAREGLSNPEISTRLFISPQTVNGTCARYSPSSTSARAGSFAGHCRSLCGAPCRFRATSVIAASPVRSSA